MFGFGLLEIFLILGLLSWLFRDRIARRLPKYGKMVSVVLYITVALVILWDVLTLVRQSP